MAQEIGTFVMPVIASFDGIDAQINKAVGGKFDDIGKKAGQDFAKLFGDSAEASMKRLFDNQSKLAEKAADATKKLKDAQDDVNKLTEKGVTSGARYERAIQAQEKARTGEAKAIKAAADALKDYDRAAGSSGGGILDKLKGAVGDIRSTGTEAASGFVEGFGGPIAEIGTKAGPIGTALAAAAGVALIGGTLIGKGVLAGLEQEAQADVIQARLGLDEQSMVKLSDAAGHAFASNFGDSIQSNLDAASSALQSGLLTGADDPNTQKVIERLSTVSQLLGEDIPRVARSTSQLIRTGMAQDLDQAFDLIVKGQQQGLNVSEDWLDTLDEYSTQFRKLGISGPEAIGLLSQAVKGGARDTDLAADALKEFSIRVVDGSKTTADAFSAIGLDADVMAAKFAQGGPVARDAFDQTVDAIRGIEDPVKRAQVAVGLFGTQAEDLGGALQNFDLSTAVQQIGNVNGAAQQAADTMGNNTAASVETAKRAVELGASSMEKSLADAFGPGLQQLAGSLVAHQDDITGFFKTAANAGAEFGSVVTGAASGIVRAFGLLTEAVGDTLGFVTDGFENMVGAAATVADAVGLHGLAGDLNDAKRTLGDFSDDFHGWGESITGVSDSLFSASVNLHNFDAKTADTAQNTAAARDRAQELANVLNALPGSKQIDVNAIVTFKDSSGLIIPPDQLRTPSFIPAVAGEARPRGGGRAAGGPIIGPGGPTSDIIPILASNGEHMWTAAEVNAVGGQDSMYRLRAAARAGVLRGFAEGGEIGPDVLAAQDMVGTPYSQANRTDCSGMVARVIDRAMGLPEAGLMSTKNAADWLTARGFKPGIGGPGMISVGWYDHGPNPNDGHMAMTLSDGTNAEAGGAHGEFLIGSGAKGADDPQFDQHMYLPTIFGEGPAGSASSPYGSTATSVGGGTYTPPDAKTVREAKEKVADADSRVKQAEAKQRELEADAKESQKIAAQADVDKAKREAADARSDLAEVMKGKYEPGKATGGARQGGLGQFGELGSIAGSFLKETFGLDGSFLPDLSSLGIVQTGGALLNAFAGPLQGFLDGGLGIQQPGWSPGDPVNGMSAPSLSPFGDAATQLPPLPADGMHPGTGASPGPVTIDNSTTVTSTGDPVDVENRIRRANMNRPRIDSYALPGS